MLRAGAADAAGNQSAWAELTVQFGGTRTQPAAVTHIDNAVAGLSLATAVAQAPDASLFIACKAAAKGGCASASPFGKLLRFNDDGGIPGDNPHFNTQNGVARAIWARGLRPAACGLQPAQPVHVRFATGSGRINLNDVGQNIWEEINVGTPGADCGCPASEGSDNVTAGRHRRPTAPWPVLTRSGVVHFSAPQSEIGGADNAQP